MPDICTTRVCATFRARWISFSLTTETSAGLLPTSYFLLSTLVINIYRRM